ncbi:MAG: bifunctional hydroxymethylpyrimidine kinase/phosphomethylpyrimidine kinase [Rhodospirillales bacterium]
MPGRVLIIAGSDSGGGAGIQADIKTVTALGGYAATAITALTAQNTRGVFGIHDVPAEFVALQMRLVLDDIGADCVKIGMLHRTDVIAAVCDVLRTNARGVPVVVDPVMIAKGGDALLTADGAAAIKAELIPLAKVLTPNLPEAVALCGGEAGDPTELARRLLALGPEAVLVKGGHGEGPRIVDLLACRDGTLKRFESDRIDTPHTHGTGCTLASAIATGLAQGKDVAAAVERARAYVLEAIRTAPGLGSGHGPLNHGHTVRPFPGAA